MMSTTLTTTTANNKLRNRKNAIITQCISMLVVLVVYHEFSKRSSSNVNSTNQPQRRFLASNVDITYITQIEDAKKESSSSLPSEIVPLNEDSSLYKHIISIEHIPTHRRIEVKLRPSPRCPRPSFVGRLSGKTLGMIKWDSNKDVAPFESPIISGYYNLPENGQYFIEIIILYCKEPDDYEDLRNKIVEHPEYHRLTTLGATIKVIKNSSSGRGYWESPIETPLYTRWQPQGCRGEKEMEERCTSKMTLKPFEKYSFKWNAFKNVPRLKDVKYGGLSRDDARFWSTNSFFKNCFLERRTTDDKCSLCTVGASNSRLLFRYLEAINVTNIGYIQVIYPRELNATMAQEIMDGCSIILLGFGQWSASGNSRDTPAYFRDQMRDVLTLFSSHRGVNVQDLYYGPLGDLNTHVPARDFRTPPIVDRYNELVRQLCLEMGVPFVNTGFITKPMWDSSEDWNHLAEKVQIVEAQYFAGLFQL